MTEDKVKADILNSFFGSIFTQKRLSDIPEFNRVEMETQEVLDTFISPGVIEDKLQALNPSSAPGPDDIDPRVLREARRELSVPLALLYRKSLDSGTIPKDWTLGRIVPIFKKGDRQDPGNYRPVSLTAVTCNVRFSNLLSETRFTSTLLPITFMLTVSTDSVPVVHVARSWLKYLRTGAKIWR